MCRAVTRALGAEPKMPAMPDPPPPPAAPPPPPPTPTQMQPGTGAPPSPSESPVAQEASERARRQAASQRGRATTILTGGQGLMGDAPTARPTATKALLGG